MKDIIYFGLFFYEYLQQVAVLPTHLECRKISSRLSFYHYLTFCHFKQKSILIWFHLLLIPNVAKVWTFGNTVFDLLLKWHHKYSLFVLITSFLGIPQAFVRFYRPMFAFISSSKGLKTRHHFFLKCLHFHSEKKTKANSHH